MYWRAMLCDQVQIFIVYSNTEWVLIILHELIIYAIYAQMGCGENLG